MLTQNWKPSYGNNDPHILIANTVLDYFTDIGLEIIKARKEGIKVPSGAVYSESSITSMRDVGMSAVLLNGTGTLNRDWKSSEVAIALFDKSNMKCCEYIETIYKMICKEMDWTYDPHPHMQIYTFKDFYEFINEFAERDEFGYHVINNELALHIYANKRQVNICKKDSNDLWTSEMNLVFVPEDKIVNTYGVVDGVAEYEYPSPYKMNDLIDVVGIDELVDSLRNAFNEIKNITLTK